MRIRAKVLMLLTSVIVCVALGQHERGGEGSLLVNVIIVAILNFIATAFHEAGHVVAVRYVRARLIAFAVFPFVYRIGERRIRSMSRGHHGDLGGYVSYSLDAIDASRKRALIAAAGPLASVAMALFVALISTRYAQGFGQDLLIALAVLSGGAGLANIIPFKGSDGAQILAALRARRRPRGPA